jgi:hypothetical protein
VFNNGVVSAPSFGTRTAMHRSWPSRSGHRSVRVPIDGYLKHARCFYRASEGLVHERVELRFDRDQVWILHRGAGVARYERSYEQGIWLPPPIMPPELPRRRDRRSSPRSDRAARASRLRGAVRVTKATAGERLPYLLAKLKAPRVLERLEHTAERARRESRPHDQFLETLLGGRRLHPRRLRRPHAHPAGLLPRLEDARGLRLDGTALLQEAARAAP